jgi:hypothetical protein
MVTLTWMPKDHKTGYTVWAADFETPAGSSTFLLFFLGQHRQE